MGQPRHLRAEGLWLPRIYRPVGRHEGQPWPRHLYRVLAMAGMLVLLILAMLAVALAAPRPTPSPGP
jgi:hypothetical protein